MTTTHLQAATTLSDADLLAHLRFLAGREREATAELVAHLAELDTRPVLLAQGYGTLFTYCTEALKLSEDAAYNRMVAARTVRRFPMVLDLLAGGSVNLTTLRLIAPHLTAQNHRAVLDEATGRSKREVEALVARLAPQPEMPATIRRLPVRAGSSAPTTEGIPSAPSPAPALLSAEQSPTVPTPSPSPSAPPSSVPSTTTQAHGADRPTVTMVAPERYRMQLTMGADTHDKLRRLQDLLRREIPDGDPAAIVDRALSLLLEDVERKKLAATSKPRPGRASEAGSRHIPAEVKRVVWRRDRGQCAFVSGGGRRCNERAFLEYHHVEPFAIGGPATVGNISLRCRGHNAYEGELVFGPYGPNLVRESPALYGCVPVPERVRAAGGQASRGDATRSLFGALP